MLKKHSEGKARYNCDICDYKTNIEMEYKQHQFKEHDGNADFKCKECDYGTCVKREFKEHLLKHNKGTAKYQCTICDYKTNDKRHYDNHMVREHDIGLYKFKCKTLNCSYRTNDKSHYNEHLLKHNKGTGRFQCHHDTCDFETNIPSFYDQHLLTSHGIGDAAYECKHCGLKTNHRIQYMNHMLSEHGKGKARFKCEDCQFETCHKGAFDEHVLRHCKGTAKYNCDMCDFRTNNKTYFEDHLFYRYKIGDPKYLCKTCGYGTNSKENHLKHLSYIHDIGDKKCSFCCGNRFSSITYKDHLGEHQICKRCYKKATGKESRAELVMSQYLDKEFGINYLLGSDVSLRQMGGCQRYRPDKMYVGPNLVIVVECDEHQHKRSNGSYECEEKRISDIYEEEGICGKTLVVIKWNPDSYKPIMGGIKVDRTVRLEMLVEQMNEVLRGPHEDKIHVYYMFYDMENPRICQNIRFTHVQ